MNRNILYTWRAIRKTTNKQNSTILNFGPAHPAAHGVLRLVLQLSGEIIQRLDIHIGLLHRGTESLMLQKHYIKSIPYFDRLDYVSMMTQEHAFCLGIERLLGYNNVPTQINLIRILFDELTRILNHFLAVGCHALDIGSMSSLFWAFEEREKIMNFYERVSGARMHAAFHRPVNEFEFIMPRDLIEDMIKFVQECFMTLNEMHNVLTYNAIWKKRLINIGVLSYENCVKYALTGVMARSSGLKTDLRLARTNCYSGYSFMPLKSYIGVNGDCYDRYLIRMLEMGESLSLVNFILTKFVRTTPKKYSHLSFTSHFYKKNKKKTYTSMEDLINHFIEWHSGFVVKEGTTLALIESPKGTFGVSLHSNNTSKPAKCKIRSPSYFNLQALPILSKGHSLADLAALVGTIDIVFGEIDR